MTRASGKVSPTQTIDARDLQPPGDASRSLPFAPSHPSFAPPPAAVGPASWSAPPQPLPSARAYSDDAAKSARPENARRARKAREPVQRRALVETLAIDPGIGRRMRREVELAELLLEHRRHRGAREALGDDAPPSPADREALDVLTVCSFAAPTSVRALREAQEAAAREGDRLQAPLGVLRGKLTPSLNLTAAFQALSAMAQSTAQRDKRAQPLCAAIDDALGGLGQSTPKAFERLSSQLDGWLSSLGFGPSHASETLTRRLLEQRAFRKLTLLGGEWMRADLEVDATSHVVYLPADAAARLPLLPSLQVVVIVELRPREDASETSSEALLARAVTRVLAG